VEQEEDAERMIEQRAGQLTRANMVEIDVCG
jgi:hypothetical protein